MSDHWSAARSVGLVYVGQRQTQHPGACTANFMRYDANAMENRTALACASPAGVTITARRGRLDTRARAFPDAARRVKGARARCPAHGTVCRKTTDGARSAPAAGSAASASASAVPGRPLAWTTGRGTAVGRHTRHARPR